MTWVLRNVRRAGPGSEPSLVDGVGEDEERYEHALAQLQDDYGCSRAEAVRRLRRLQEDAAAAVAEEIEGRSRGSW